MSVVGNNLQVDQIFLNLPEMSKNKKKGISGLEWDFAMNLIISLTDLRHVSEDLDIFCDDCVLEAIP